MKYCVNPGQKIYLKDWDPGETSFFQGEKRGAKKKLKKLNKKLESLQELLFAEGRQKVLIVLQGMDSAGKDGTIRHVFEGVNPQGVKVAGFKKPTQEELAHDYLWRVHKQTPGSGEIVIFNRSHYEDVLVVRVHNLVPESRWKRRFDHINAFEKFLADEGTIIRKFFLHISPEEQKQRLQDRLDTPEKQWKFRKGDLDERKLWPQYIEAFEDVLSRTSTEWAPWYIIPADHKWYRNLLISQVIIETLESLGMEYPLPEEDLDGIIIE